MKKAKSAWPLRIGAAAACLAAIGAGLLFREELADTMAGSKGPAIVRADMADKLADQGEITLKVQDYAMGGFMRQYGRAFTIQHPSVQLEIVEVAQNDGMMSAMQAYRAFIEEKRPDVLRVPFALYGELAKEGLLLPLDSRMAEDGYGAQQFYAPVIDTLREAGGGELFGLANEFEAQAVFVNPQLFEQHGMPLPEGAMTWEELLQTAASFRETGVYGLATELPSEPLALVAAIGRTEGLQLADREGMRATVSGDAWEKIWTLVAENVKAGTVFKREPGDELQAPYYMEEAYRRDPFMTGEAAIRVGWHYYASNLLDASQWDELTVDWTAIPEPVRADQRSESTSFGIGEVFAIAADSPNSTAAWELIKLVTSDAIANRTGGIMNRHNLSARSDVAVPDEGRREAFYQLDVDPARVMQQAKAQNEPGMHKASQAFYRLGSPLMQSVLKGSLTVPEALAELQSAMDAELASAPMKEAE